jgi:DNA-directed RNA polymerase subunit RPC12/RpoP
MAKVCSICGKEKPLEAYNTRYLFCKNCQYNRSKSKHNIKNDNVRLMSEIYNLSKLSINSKDRNLINILRTIKKNKIDLIEPNDEKIILKLPFTIAEPAYNYFKKCTEYGMSLTNIQDSMYAKMDSNIFREHFGVERTDFIKVSHELSILIDYIRCLKDAYNQFIEDRNFTLKRINPDLEKMKDIQTFYNFDMECIETTDNPLKLDKKTFLKKLRDETQNHYGLMYFHQKHYFDRWYEEYDV